MTDRNIYLNVIPYKEALDKFIQELQKMGILKIDTEEIDVRDGLGRTLAQPVFAKVSSPHYHSCAMDGIATNASFTAGATETSPIILEPDKFQYVDTGDPLPTNFDCVIMIEDITPLDEGRIEITSSAARWQHVRGIGEDLIAGELIHPVGTILGPTDIGAVLAGGQTLVKVAKKPTVAIIPTGDELVAPGEMLKAGDIIEYNGTVLKCLVNKWGGEGNLYPIQRDNLQGIIETLEDAIEKHDIVVINAGSSAGSEDFTSKAVKRLGKLLIHGVAIKPGRPVILGIVKDKPVIGLPGYPVSCVLTAELFLKPLIYLKLGIAKEEPPTVEGHLSRPIPSTIGSEEFVRVKLGVIDDKIVATPISRGAGLITSLTKADGIITVPLQWEGIGTNQKVKIRLLSSFDKIKNTILAVGSHDMALDIIDNTIKAIYPNISVSSAHTGSMGGIQAIIKGQCHIAGVHLFDPATGKYNIPYLEKYLKGRPVTLIRLAKRSQGFIVPKGNPLNIKDITDLQDNDIQFVNRQRGSGTRILFDYLLAQHGINPERILGYDWEEYTHTAVAAAVQGGLANCGMGIYSAAKALDMDFIPVTWEEYDLIIPSESMEWEIIKKFLEILKSKEFAKAIEGLGGYDMSDAGEIIWRC